MGEEQGHAMVPVQPFQHRQPLPQLVDPPGIFGEVHDHLAGHGLARDVAVRIGDAAAVQMAVARGGWCG
ncbi:hypothetical protein [Pseudonocardia sp.]|uniref:hypothetical protein n=1 Tax=Pseudonocardia sp. TaxID=60912 RepID=UPI003D122855